ncbi:MAG: hypothetical protein J0H94_21150 [Rhizobiales bacterium]|nr:hypothetical protein [Rhizobium tropici]MBN8997724.1 hypothetical protein [Hyphomicrobiales bacterium]MBN9489954.1 hypothetical protein [Alphaproteobacteria bacterium]
MNTDIDDVIEIEKIMNRCITDLYEEGEIEDAAITTSEFYGFSPEDVETIHFHKNGAGDGVWFRLKNGLVFDKAAEPCDPDPSLYDTTAN